MSRDGPLGRKSDDFSTVTQKRQGLAGDGFLWNSRMLRKPTLFHYFGAGAVGSSRYRRPGDDVMLRRVRYHEDGAGSMEMMSCAFRLQDDIMLPRHIGDDVIRYVLQCHYV